MPSPRLRAGLLAAAGLACAASALAPQQAAPLAAVAAPAAEPRTLAVNALLNGGFELLADSTTTPPKYGAYWVGALAAAAGDPACLVVPDGAFRGERLLRLPPGKEVLQKIVADPRFTGTLRVSLALRGGGALRVTLEDGPGRRAGVQLRAADTGLAVLGADGQPLKPAELAALAVQEATGAAARASQDATGWKRLSLDLGALFQLQHGAPPMPRLNLRLSAAPDAPSPLDLDEVTAEVRWPLPSEPELAAYAAGLVRDSLALWFDAPEHGGLGLVDPQSGYVMHSEYDVESGQPGPAEQTAGFHSIQNLLIDFLREARRRGWTADVQRWTPVLQRCVRTVLEHNFDPDTGLPRRVTLPDLRPVDRSAVPLWPWVEFLLDAREQVGDEELAGRCLQQARRIADALLALQAQHDLPRDSHPPGKWSEAHERVEGNDDNWFGFIPDRLTSKGEIETNKRFYTSWAILTGRSFWYELLRAPRAIARVHALDPRPQDVPGIRRAIAGYHRDWDAARYDLENDTDDHYGYFVADALDIVRHCGAEVPEALALLQQATDHRLEPGAARADDTLWIQAVRLGTACAGDSPRAFLGPLGLRELTPSADDPAARLYHDAVLELARNDLQGRQLTNAQFTESFFKLWEMVCICFKGTYQGDCREHEASWWHGDVGDTFGGPPTAAIDAQTDALRVASPGERLPLLAALGLVRDATDAGLRRKYGWLFGLDEAVAKQYQLLPKDVIGLSHESAAGLGYVAAWLRLLPHLGDAPLPVAPTVEVVEDGRALRVTGPPGAVVTLVQGDGLFPARSIERDPRLLPIGIGDVAAATWPPFAQLDGEGTGQVSRRSLPQDTGWVVPVVADGTGAFAAVGQPVRY
jgi:hypothetical protein